MFEKNLKRIMEEKGISVTALAKKTGFSKGAVSSWRNGLYSPSPENMLVLAEALQCGIGELTGGTTAAEPVQAVQQRTTLTVKEVATLMHKHESYIRRGLQEGRPGFEFGSAVKTSGKWSYFISVAKFTEITGIPVNI